MTEAKARVSFIVPVFNAIRFLPDSIASIRASRAAAGCAELIVVDNGSVDGSWEWLNRELGDSATLIRHPGWTVGALRNAGAGVASGSLLAFIDADCVLPEDYVARAELALARSGAAGTGSQYALPASPHWVEETWQELHRRRREGTVNYINSGNLVIRREAFEAVGGFDERLLTGEDAELGQRLARAGLPLYEAQNVIAVHLGNPKSLGQFFRKQRWHALGMFGTVDLRSVDRPTLLAAVQLLGYLGAVWALVATQVSLGARVCLGLGGLLGPSVLAVAYRLSQGGRTKRPAAAILLYFIYLFARIVATVDLGRRALLPRGRVAL